MSLFKLLASSLSTLGVVPATTTALIVGASEDDIALIRSLGFARITASNLGGSNGYLALDAENIAVSDKSYEIVFAHAVLHHCQSPHKAVLECFRVCEKHFIFLDANDSLLMRLAQKIRLSKAYEFSAVSDNNYECGGVRNSRVPNYIYRWNPYTLRQTLSAGFPAENVEVRIVRFFDIYQAGRILRALQRVANAIPGIRQQGNHFFAILSRGGYQPWIETVDCEPRLLRDYR